MYGAHGRGSSVSPFLMTSCFKQQSFLRPNFVCPSRSSVIVPCHDVPAINLSTKLSFTARDLFIVTGSSILSKCVFCLYCSGGHNGCTTGGTSTGYMYDSEWVGQSEFKYRMNVRLRTVRGKSMNTQNCTSYMHSICRGAASSRKVRFVDTALHSSSLESFSNDLHLLERGGAPCRKGCVINGRTTKASNR